MAQVGIERITEYATTEDPQRKTVPAVSAGYQTRVSYEAEDPDWDAFLVETPGGDFMQTSLWAQVKAPFGWHPARVVVTREDRIVAGAQVLIRPLPLIGAVGYTPRGPLSAVDDPAVGHHLLTELRRIVKENRIQYLMVQPPRDGGVVDRQLPEWGFRPSQMIMAPTTTILFDLTADLDALLAQMKRTTRQNIRRCLRQGSVTVREGSESDLDTFYRLHLATSERQGFLPYPEGYFATMWRAFSPHGYIKLFLAECEGDAVSALLVLAFGDTVFTNTVGWNGQYKDRKPNDLLYWSVITWAKAAGYRCCDFTWIEPSIARAVVRGEALPDPQKHAATFFKLGFGGEVTIFPGGYDYIPNPLLRRAYDLVSPAFYRSSATRDTLHRLRWRWFPSLRPLRLSRNSRREPGLG